MVAADRVIITYLIFAGRITISAGRVGDAFAKKWPVSV